MPSAARSIRTNSFVAVAARLPSVALLAAAAAVAVTASTIPAIAQYATPKAPTNAAAAPAEPQASEQEIAQARELGASGIELYESGAYPEASQQLEHAYRFVKVPTLGMWSARALDKVGDLKGAEARYREVVAMPAAANEPKVFVDARRYSQQELDLLVPRVPKLVVRLLGATADQVRITVDDIPVPADQVGVAFSVNPGSHSIVGWQGERAERVTLDMPERSAGTATLDFTPLAVATPAEAPKAPAPLADPNESRRTWGYVAVGVGGAALVTGVVATLLASGQKSDLAANCPEQQCAPEFHGQVDTLNQTLTVSLAGYIGAALGLGVGGYLLFTDTDEAGPVSSGSSGSRSTATAEPSSADTRWSVWLGPGSAGVAGRF